jgi:hypothetical protein
MGRSNTFGAADRKERQCADSQWREVILFQANKIRLQVSISFSCVFGLSLSARRRTPTLFAALSDLALAEKFKSFQYQPHLSAFLHLLTLCRAQRVREQIPHCPL